METVIMFSLVLIFGIISLLLKKYDNKKLKIIYLITDVTQGRIIRFESTKS
ncbi:MAG: hypothetical protein KJ666_16775 [Bacteroidetes bacterium]|nr:hypothetical protein [Bacteroidota bacterium]